MAGGSRRQRGEIPLDLVLIIVLVVAVGAALIWALRGSVFYTALIIVFVLGALVWTYARRIRRREDLSADQQRKVKHDASWTSGKEDE
jgi:uncharacterized membrane protein